MAGVLNTLLEGGGGSGGGTLGPLDWTNIFNDFVGFTNSQTVVASGTITISSSATGSGILAPIRNGVFLPTATNFNVSNGDVLIWRVQNPGTTPVTGTVTVTDATNSVTVDTFTYSVTKNDDR
jgi:hypothetical protein